MANPRLLYFDIAKGVGMFLVVFGHLMFTYDSRGVNTPLNQWIYSFHMALFFIISGYFFSSSLNKEFLILLKTKFYQLIVPVISWSIITFVINDLSQMNPSEMTTGIMHFLKSGCLLRGLWFLNSLFVYYISGWIAIKVLKKDWLAAIACTILISMLPKFSFVEIFPSFFWLGHLLRKNDFCLNFRYSLTIALIISIISFLFWKTDYAYVAGQKMDLISWIMRFIVGSSWSIVFILFSKYLSQISSVFRFTGILAYIGSLSLGIYCLHQAVFMNRYCKPLYSLVQNDNSYILFACSIFVFYASYKIVNLIKRNVFLSKCLLGN